MRTPKEHEPEGGRQSLTIRLSAEGHRLLSEMAKARGISRTAVLELLLRDEAARSGHPPGAS